MTYAKTPMMTRERYFARDPNVPDPWASPRRLVPPSTRRLRGKREIGFASDKGTLRGALPVNGHMEGAESGMEFTSGLFLLAHPDVIDIVSQSPKVEYVGHDGKTHTFTFDFTSVHRDRSRTANSIKPMAHVLSSEVEEIHRLLQRQMSPQVANRINLITEEKLSPEDRFNAETIYAARRRPIPAHDQVIEDLIADLHGSTTIGALREQSGLHGAAYRAIVRLIASRKLETVEHVRLDSAASVRRPAPKEAF